MVGYGTNHMRKIVVIPAEKLEPPSARFILPLTVFHWDGQPCNIFIYHLK
jgi:hypothetical protein